MINLVNKLMAHWTEIAQILAAIVGVASLIIKLIPALNKNNKLLPVIKFIAKYLALNKSVTDADRPK